jgi:hypothetical protein
MDLASIALRRRYFIHGRTLLHKGWDHQHSQKHVWSDENPYAIPSLHQLVRWNFRWLPHKPPYFPGTRLWPLSPFSWGRFKRIIADVSSSILPHSWFQNDSAPPRWNREVALRKLLRMWSCNSLASTITWLQSPHSFFCADIWKPMSVLVHLLLVRKCGLKFNNFHKWNNEYTQNFERLRVSFSPIAELC